MPLSDRLAEARRASINGRPISSFLTKELLQRKDELEQQIAQKRVFLETHSVSAIQLAGDSAVGVSLMARYKKLQLILCDMEQKHRYIQKELEGRSDVKRIL